MKEKSLYVYNFEQAKFFINNGLKVMDIAKADKGDVYIMFVRDEECERVFGLWVSRNKA